MRFDFSVLRLLLGIVLGLTLVAAVPIYGEPYIGCEEKGVNTPALACGLWLDFVIGVCAVSLVSLVGPRRLNPHVWGAGVIVAVAFLGGLPGMKSGSTIDAFLHPSSMVDYWLGSGIAMVAGGLLAAMIFMFAQKFFIRAESSEGAD